MGKSETNEEEIIVDPPPHFTKCGFCDRRIKTIDARDYAGYCACGAFLTWHLDPYDGWIPTISAPPPNIKIRPRTGK